MEDGIFYPLSDSKRSSCQQIRLTDPGFLRRSSLEQIGPSWISSSSYLAFQAQTWLDCQHWPLWCAAKANAILNRLRIYDPQWRFRNLYKWRRMTSSCGLKWGDSSFQLWKDSLSRSWWHLARGPSESCISYCWPWVGLWCCHSCAFWW